MKALLLVLLTLVPIFGAEAKRPNLIFILADDLGYGELGCYGQKVIKTPRIDAMAKEGIRFTQFYAGATVCAPSRSVLMTGQHHGRTTVRGNAGAKNPEAQALRADDVTIAKVLQEAGYATALVGKWGLGNVGGAESGLPRKHGFNYFVGYLSQTHAHNHFPNYLWRNEEKIALPNDLTAIGPDGAGYSTNQVLFADDFLTDEALRFVARNQDKPFFLYWSPVVPHANNERNRALKNGTEVPDFGRYAKMDWPEQDKAQAAWTTRLDSYVGRMLDQLKALGLAENTLVVFTSDNGPHNEAHHNLDRFQPSGPLRGIKRSLYDGGIRVPFIAWWPKTIPAGKESAHVGYFGDWFATAAELAGAKAPGGLDSISFAPTLLGEGRQQKHGFLYWEFHENGFKQAALWQGRWKGIRENGFALYDLQTDAGETNNVAAAQPEIGKRIQEYLATARSESEHWPAK